MYKHNSKLIKQLFNIKKTTQKDYYTNDNPHFPIRDLSYSGYRGLYMLHLHFSIKGIERWQKYKKVRFPKKCCHCNRPQEMLLTMYKKPKWYKSPVPYLLDIPHCQEHGQDQKAKLIVESHDYYGFEYKGFFNFSKDKEKYKKLEHPLTSIILLGTNLDFLQELLDINTQKDGDYYPPWIVFKNSEPYSFKQGIQEYWSKEGWFPFENGLGEHGYKDYLKRWNASDDWIEHNEACIEYSKKKDNL